MLHIIITSILRWWHLVIITLTFGFHLSINMCDQGSHIWALWSYMTYSQTTKTLNITITSLGFIFTIVNTRWFSFGLKNNAFFFPPIRPPWRRGAQILKWLTSFPFKLLFHLYCHVHHVFQLHMCCNSTMLAMSQFNPLKNLAMVAFLSSSTNAHLNRHALIPNK